MSKLNIPILLGTGRLERQSEKVANYVLKKSVEFGFDSKIIDVRDHMLQQTTPPWQDKSAGRKWSKIMQKADGLIIVSPEYHHSYPGELKIMLDSIEDEYVGKPVSICAVSSGLIGGARMVEHLWSVLIALHMMATGSYVNFPVVQDLFNADGSIKNKKIEEKMMKMFKEIEMFVKALKDDKKELS